VVELLLVMLIHQGQTVLILFLVISQHMGAAEQADFTVVALIVADLVVVHQTDRILQEKVYILGLHISVHLDKDMTEVQVAIPEAEAGLVLLEVVAHTVIKVAMDCHLVYQEQQQIMPVAVAEVADKVFGATVPVASVAAEPVDLLHLEQMELLTPVVAAVADHIPQVQVAMAVLV
jgi:hypothetical protein